MGGPNLLPVLATLSTASGTPCAPRSICACTYLWLYSPFCWAFYCASPPSSLPSSSSYHRCIRRGDVQYRLRTLYRPVLTRVPPPGKDRQRRGGRCRISERYLRGHHRAADIWTAPVGTYSIEGADNECHLKS